MFLENFMNLFHLEAPKILERLSLQEVTVPTDSKHSASGHSFKAQANDFDFLPRLLWTHKTSQQSLWSKVLPQLESDNHPDELEQF